MAKKKAKKKTTRKPTVQEQLAVLCDLVNRINERIAQLQLEIGSLRSPTTTWPTPWKTDPPAPFEVTCKGPPAGLMYNCRADAIQIVSKGKKR